MAYCNINKQTKLYYEEHGRGEKTLVFVNGLAMMAGTWIKQIEYFKDKYRIIVYDQRCQGRSSKEKKPFHYTLLVNDLRLLMEHTQTEKATILGISYGSFIAKEFAVRYPDSCEKLVLLTPLRQADFTYRKIHDIWLGLLQKKELDIFFDVLLCQSYSRGFLNSLEKNYLSIRAEIKKYYTGDSIIRLLKSFDFETDFKNYNKIKVPTLVIGAKQDLLHNYHNAMQIAAEIKDARPVLIDSGHAVIIERAAAVNKAIALFLKKKP